MLSANHPIRALIIDDEREAHDVLARLLQRIGGVTIVGHVSDPDEVPEMVRLYQPEIVFLDIQMPGKDGICVANELKKNKLQTTIIFVTAFSDYALAALKASAFDYLLKPVDVEELRTVIDRYRMERGSNSLENKLDLLIENFHQKQKLLFHTRSGCILVDVGDILYGQADVNYTRLFLSGKREELVTMNISRVMGMLPPNVFYRLGRSHIINLSCVRKVDRSLKICELVKDQHLCRIKAPLAQLKDLEISLSRFS